MKKFITFLLLGALPLLSQAQIKFENQSLTKPDSNLLIQNYQNSIFIEGVKDISNCNIISSKGKIKVTDNTFLLNPGSENSETISIFKEGVLIAKKSFKTAPMSEPVIQIANSNNQTISKAELISTPVLTIGFPNSILKPEMQISEYRVLVMPTQGDPIEFTMSNAMFSDGLIRTISSLKSGDKILFENVKAISVNGEEINYSKKMIQVK